MNILVVSQYYYPESVRITDLCESLVERGHTVSVVTGIPNYPEGRFFLGYSWSKKRNEQIKGVIVHRLTILPRGKNFLCLSMNYISFVISGWFYSLKAHNRPDVVFNYEISPITQCLVGIWFGKKHKIPVISYILDLWPESFQEVTGNTSKIIERMLGRLVNSIYTQSDVVLTSSQSFIQSIAARGIQSEKITFWPQYAEDFYFSNDSVESNVLVRDGRVLITFAGNIGVAQGLDILIPVARKLKGQNQSVCFVLIGDGRDKNRLESLVESEGLQDYFMFITKQPPQMIPSYLASSDAGLLILKKSDIFSMTIPAKLQTYLACGIPIIGSVDGEAQRIIKQANAGLVADAENIDQLVAAISTFYALSPNARQTMGESARKYAMEHYNKKVLLDNFDTLLQSLAKD
ncbi:glycosyltransferase family 4 protein [Sphaerochaeta globosa]|uniref:Glycosyl transferase group 1 n=1 Tax=Sphaerochaeta globosa (strain ATCC BAA-1886 / DSM 22777 / Buddy) TaxID=158189 RepID=F0RXP5_SPHGB|nr:glycosyltransferase family 4 protein [Sphaerochaeta globosa]ADY12095.1 glycosyl transferase group 1 [Sphaerochaeta globosa str. Buddy]